MSSEESPRQQQSHFRRNVVIIAVVAIMVIVALILIFRGRTTIKQNHKTEAEETSLHCSASGVDNGVFDTYGAISAEYVIDVIFYDDRLDNLTYTYKGTYADPDTAEAARSNIMAAFNRRLGELSLQENHFGSKNASLDDVVFRYVVYAEDDDITVDSASMLMIDVDRESANPYIPASQDEIKANYQNHGFICKSGA